jgi:hypothetical protein
MVRIVCALSLCLAAACGKINPSDEGDAGGPTEGDAAAQPPDAGTIDAQPQPPPTPSREFIGGAGRASSATYTLDVEIGLPIAAQRASGATYTIEANTAVKP